jgi:hypothetical protein
VTQCHVCGWSRGHDYGCPNDPLNPGAASVASPAAPASPSVAQAEPSEDTKRLDWLQRDMLFSEPTGIEWSDGAFTFPYLVSNAGGCGGGVGHARFKSLREAIDAARASAGEAQATLPSTPKAEGRATPAPAASAQPQAPQAEVVEQHYRDALHLIIGVTEGQDCPGLDKPTDFAIAQSRGIRLATVRRMAVKARAAPPSATAQAAPQTTAASAQALGEAGEVKP